MGYEENGIRHYFPEDYDSKISRQRRVIGFPLRQTTSNEVCLRGNFCTLDKRIHKRKEQESK